MSGTRWPEQWPKNVAALATATAAAVDAVAADDRDALADATAQLTLFADLARRLHAEVVRALLESSHPSGIEGDDVQELVVGICDRHPQWTIDPTTLVLVVLGALGVEHDRDPEDDTPVRPLTDEVSARYASLVIAHLADGRESRRSIERAITDIARADTISDP